MVKRLLFKSVLAIILSISVIISLGWVCTNYDGQYVYRMMNEMYDCENNIDVLFLGSSHVYRSYDTMLADELLGQKTFNAGSSSQGMASSYYLLKEICEYHDIKEVYLDTYYGLSNMNENDASVFIVSDYMRWGVNKRELLYNSGGFETLLYGGLVYKRNYTNCNIVKNIRSRLSDISDYSSVSYDNEEYRGDGFVYSFETITDIADVDFSVCAEYDFSENVPVNEYYYKYLIKLIEFCDENDVKLILVDQPMLRQNTDAVIDYNNYVQFYRKIAEQYNLEYWNFNLYKDELGLNVSDYKDADHLNGAGAEKYTKLFCQLIQMDRKPGNIQGLFRTEY